MCVCVFNGIVLENRKYVQNTLIYQCVFHSLVGNQ